MIPHDAGPAPPELSVVLATSSAPAARRSLAAYAAQSAAARLEMVLVAPAAVLESFDAAALARFGALRRVAAAEPFGLPAARAQGALAATAPWVFVAETHSYPAERMCEELLAAIAAAEGEGTEIWVPAIHNANPTNAASWASLVIDYGAWGPGQPASATWRPPIYNALFARQRLARLGTRLPAALSPHDDTVFPHSEGLVRPARFAPRARIDHLNVDRLGPFCRSKTWTGMTVAALRARRWGWPRRLAYAAAAPLIAAVLLARSWRDFRTSRRRGDAPLSAAPWLVTGAAVRAWGEAVAYLGWTPRDLEAKVQRMEIHKREFVADWID